MDPVSQGTLGAMASQNIAGKHIAIATVLGFMGGLAPDLDILIRSETDPLLFLEYHRQFTHSLVFIPIGGLICAAIAHWLFARRKGLPFRRTLLYCTAGYATHALLDACTSYGTQLFWPFSNMRIAWNFMSIIDPLFTLPTLMLVIIATVRRKPLFARFAVIWLVSYMAFGIAQRERIESAGHALAQSRGHQPLRLEAKPGFGNQLLWKVVYETESRFYVDGFRAGPKLRHYPGDSLPKLDVERDFPWLDPDSQQALDIERFSWFSDGFVAVPGDDPDRIADIRYSMVPNEIDAIWMIGLDPQAGPDQHAAYYHEHQAGDNATRKLWDMLVDNYPDADGYGDAETTRVSEGKIPANTNDRFKQGS